MLGVQSPAAARSAAGLGRDSSVPLDDPAQAYLHLAALHRPGTYLELRVKQERGMQQRFFSDPRAATSPAVVAGRGTDVYVGVLPRLRQAGGRDALPSHAATLWAEADNEAAMCRAMDFEPHAQLVVESSPGKAHFYWFLDRPIPLAYIEQGNKRLAFHLGCDPKATDAPRILRVAGTRNHKRGEPTRVAAIRFEATANLAPAAVAGWLLDPAPARPLARPHNARRDYIKDPDTSVLRNIPAREYIPILSGREVYQGFCRCPFHKGGEERTPSLSVGGPNEELWLCFGCDEGGDIFTFAARLWGLDEQSDFPEIKARVKRELEAAADE